LIQAGWHIADEPVAPANVTPVFLPPYSPELSPIERLWLYLKDNQLSHCVFDTTADIIDACCDARMRVPVEGDHGFRWKLITQSGGT
jgi:transposase